MARKRTYPMHPLVGEWCSNERTKPYASTYITMLFAFVSFIWMHNILMNQMRRWWIVLALFAHKIAKNYAKIILTKNPIFMSFNTIGSFFYPFCISTMKWIRSNLTIWHIEHLYKLFPWSTQHHSFTGLVPGGKGLKLQLAKVNYIITLLLTRYIFLV